MRLPSQSRPVSRQSRQLVRTLDRLRTTLDLSEAVMSELLGINHSDYKKVIHRKTDLPAFCLVNLAERFNLNPSSILRGDIDFETLAAHYSGDLEYIPEKYMRAACSRRRTAANILDYAERSIGWVKTQQLKRKLQLSDSALKNHDAFINIELLIDLLGGLRKLGMSDVQLAGTGAHSLIMNRAAPFAVELSKSESLRSLYERMLVEFVPLIERNCDNTLLKLDDNGCIIRITSNSDVATALGREHLTDRNACLYKAGFLAAPPSYVNLPFAQVTETSCVNHGDSSCKFAVNFESAKARISH